MLIGRTGCGKTTLTQKLLDEEVKYKKTQSVTYKSKIIRHSKVNMLKIRCTINHY